jgi:hypothetical protein
MATIRLKHQRHSYVNAARVPCTLGIEVDRVGEFVELRRIRSDGRQLSRMLLTLEEAEDLSRALAQALGDA